MDSNPHIDGDLIPWFILQILLSLYGSFECLSGFMEGCTKCIANDLKDKAIVIFNCFAQYGVMAPPSLFPHLRMLAGQFGTVFYICKEKSDCATRLGGHIASLWVYPL